MSDTETFKLETLKGTIKTADGRDIEIEFTGPKTITLHQEHEELRVWPATLISRNSYLAYVTLEVQRDPKTGVLYVLRFGGVTQ